GGAGEGGAGAGGDAESGLVGGGRACAVADGTQRGRGGRCGGLERIRPSRAGGRVRRAVGTDGFRGESTGRGTVHVDRGPRRRGRGIIGGRCRSAAERTHFGAGRGLARRIRRGGDAIGAGADRVGPRLGGLPA